MLEEGLFGAETDSGYIIAQCDAGGALRSGGAPRGLIPGGARAPLHTC